MISDDCIDLPTAVRSAPQVLSSSPRRLVTGRRYGLSWWCDTTASKPSASRPDACVARMPTQPGRICTGVPTGSTMTRLATASKSTLPSTSTSTTFLPNTSDARRINRKLYGLRGADGADIGCGARLLSILLHLRLGRRTKTTKMRRGRGNLH